MLAMVLNGKFHKTWQVTLLNAINYNLTLITGILGSRFTKKIISVISVNNVSPLTIIYVD